MPGPRTCTKSNETESSYVDILSKLQAALTRIQTLEAEAVLRDEHLVMLEGVASVTKTTNKLLVERIDSIKHLAVGNSQYARHETVEIHGIPESAPDCDVEEKVMLKSALTIFKLSTETANKNRVIIANKNRVVIAKFISHKKQYQAILSRKNLKSLNLKNIGLHNKNIHIDQSMTNYIVKLRFNLEHLWELKKIKSFWFFNGKL